ncbi:hypothetical protein [Sphingomonas sp. M1-B02]|uniref:hypothetical protein n=1 Tax=Sphingomonas sp. M1-B02 TaxID=3114300 RepID=UPI0022403873|nr:hypothetical protein [Sphingomonas sp. S6-11]UZK67766.1 hypothetical protein OKW87_08040 [Sphingomonas sp. S6-11]
MKLLLGTALGAAIGLSGVASAQSVSGDVATLRKEIAAERALIEEQRAAIDRQSMRLQALEAQLVARIPANDGQTEAASNSPTAVPLPPSPPPSARQAGEVMAVGEAPTDQRQVEVAVLADQGGIITSSGRLTIEGAFEYAHADRNRVVFRGVAIPEAVLIGAFDINESRQNVMTAAIVARLGVSSRFEINGRLPYVRRSDQSTLAPVVNNGNAQTGTDRSITNGNLGDVDFGMRYQVTDGGGGLPYLIAGVQAVAPTGTDPFAVPRDALGNPLEAATGAGFWGVTPNLTAVLPTDPAVLFGTMSYTYNFSRKIGGTIGSAFVDRVSPGGAPSASVGIAVSLNPRTSFSLGYALTIVNGTETRLQTINPQNGVLSDPMTVLTRDLQLGRLLFGMSYRVSPKTTLNWNVEIGATEDATDLRTSLRIPLTFNLF